MKLLLFSDSHGQIDRLQAMMARVQQSQKPDAILFAGDGLADLSYLNADCPVHAVRGNCDFLSTAKEDLLLRYAGHTIYLTHGHAYRVKRTLGLLIAAAKEKQADIVVYGHNHSQQVEWIDQVYCINPGALSNGEYALMHLDQASVKVELFQL